MFLYFYTLKYMHCGQSKEISVTEESQMENSPSFFGRPFSLLCLAAAQKITHAAHSLLGSGELYVKAGCVSTLSAE